MSENPERHDQATMPTWISAGLLVAAVPVAANLFAFIYEVGYCRVFGIPASFISLQPTTVFVVAGALVVVLFVLLLIADTVVAIFTYYVPQGPIRRSFVVLGPFLLVFVAYLYLYRGMWKEWAWLAPVVAVVAFFEFVFPLIFQRRGSYRDKLEAQEEIERGIRTLTYWLGARVGRAGMLLMVALTIGLVIAYAAGRAEALRQENFLVLGGDPEAVVLRHYGDTLILAPFDREGRKVERSFFILKEGDESRPLFSLEEVGPLRSGR